MGLRGSNGFRTSIPSAVPHQKPLAFAPNAELQDQPLGVRLGPCVVGDPENVLQV